MDNNTYLICDGATKLAAIVDPSFDSDKLLPEIISEGWDIRYILLTHAHFDHCIENAFYVRETDALLALHRGELELLRMLPQQAEMFGFTAEPSPEPTLFLEEGQTLRLGDTEIKVLLTAGHSPASVTFEVGNELIVGDALFAGSVGRTDLPGSSWQTLLHSIKTQLLTQPDDTIVWPGHGEPTTIGKERATNPFLCRK